MPEDDQEQGMDVHPLTSMLRLVPELGSFLPIHTCIPDFI